MHRTNYLASLRLWLGTLLAAFIAGALAPAAALAQTTLSVDPALGKVYRPQTWVPVRLRLTNQGAPARVEVRARFVTGPEGVQEYHTPEINLPSGANDVRYLYVKAPVSYSNQPLTIELLRDGRQIYKTTPTLTMLADGDWLVTAFGPDAATASLNILSNARLKPNTRNWSGTGSFNPGNTSSVQVALLDPTLAPDRGVGLEGTDMVVLAGVSATDFAPEQLTALRDYVYAGGTLIVTGGVNAGRFKAPFFRDLLPVDVTAAGTRSALRDDRGQFKALPSGQFPVCLGTARPDADVLLTSDGAPMIASARRGSGQVLFFAFDPANPPFRDWTGLRGFWTEQLETSHSASSIVRAISMADGRGSIDDSSYNYGNRGARLADAPFAIPQLDIPAFYVVALFLLAYIVFLVPVNYFFLKAKDKKEYAWLTTPAIVLVFSFGAYMIGYGFKGGRTLVVKVGVMETHLGQDAAPAVFYAGLFSPRKTGYNVELPAGDPGTPNAVPSLFFSEPDLSRASIGMRQVQSDTQRVPDFAIDMWAMRVLKLDGTVRFGDGKGFQGKLARKGDQLEGSVVNNTPYTLEDCRLLSGLQTTPLGEFLPGKEVAISANLAPSQGAQGALPSSAGPQINGKSEDQRMKRAVLQVLNRTAGAAPTGPDGRPRPVIIGWVRDSVAPLQVNGASAREQSKTLLVLHLQ